MGLFAAITGLLKRYEYKYKPVNHTEIVTTTGSTDVGEISMDVGDVSMEEGCACGGSCTCGGACTCKEEPEQEVVNEAYTTQATLPGMYDISVVTKPEAIPTIHKIDAVSPPPVSLDKLTQSTLPGFDDVVSVTSNTKKRSRSTKVSVKLPRKSTAKRKK